MKTASRIPLLNQVSFNDAKNWFAELSVRGLIFHPDDDPAEIFYISNGKPLFSNQEVIELRAIIDQLFKSIADDLYEAAYPAFMKAAGQQFIEA